MIAVLITVHNRIDKTLLCLKQLKQAATKITIPIHIYLVDDGSTDGTSERLKAEHPNVRIIQGTGELYWNRGMRLAWEAASQASDYDYYLWLNNDTYVFPDSLKELTEQSESFNKQAILCAQTCSELDQSPTYGARNRNKEGLQFKNGTARCDIINGNLVLIPKYVYGKIGSLDKRFHHSLGDFDYSLRAAKLGIASYVTEEPKAFCEYNLRPWVWCRHEVSLMNRVKNLYSSAGGNPPQVHFQFELRHYGVFIACYHYITMHIRVLFPKLWSNH